MRRNMQHTHTPHYPQPSTASTAFYRVFDHQPTPWLRGPNEQPTRQGGKRNPKQRAQFHRAPATSNKAPARSGWCSVGCGWCAAGSGYTTRAAASCGATPSRNPALQTQQAITGIRESLQNNNNNSMMNSYEQATM